MLIFVVIFGTLAKFPSDGPSWAERASRGELTAVFSPDATDRRNLFLHTVSLYAANRALALTRERGSLLRFRLRHRANAPLLRSVWLVRDRHGNNLRDA